MDIDKKLELLKKIQKVDAPPFLLTRILGRIDSAIIGKAPATWKLAFIAVALVMIALNISILLMSSDQPTTQGLSEVISELDLSTSNQLYNE